MIIKYNDLQDFLRDFRKNRLIVRSIIDGGWYWECRNKHNVYIIYKIDGGC